MKGARQNPTHTTAAKSKDSSVKPSDVHKLKVQAQQATQKAKTLRTQANRLNDQILAHSNAIKKTREQQSNVPAVATHHANRIIHLKRSVEGAENSLASLRAELTGVRECDQTFMIKELKYEVRLMYCENQRMTSEHGERKGEATAVEHKLAEASRQATSQNLQRMKADIRTLQGMNADLRDKTVAYNAKKQKLQIDRKVKDNWENKVPTAQTVEASDREYKETSEKARTQAEQLEAEKTEHATKVSELNAILEEQRQKVIACLSGKPMESTE